MGSSEDSVSLSLTRSHYAQSDPRFGWTRFYEAVATRLATFQNRRDELVRGIQDIAAGTPLLGYLLHDTYPDGTTGFPRDLDPFTVLGTFNRGVELTARQAIAREVAILLSVEDAVPNGFDGIPLLNNQQSWFFPRENKRSLGHIEALWEVFLAALNLFQAEANPTGSEADFVKSYDKASDLYAVGWNLTMGLFWIRPWEFPPLDKQSREYLSKTLTVHVATDGSKRRCSGADYLATRNLLTIRFAEPGCPVHSFPEMSLRAFEASRTNRRTVVPDTIEPSPGPVAFATYGIDDIVSDGCFLSRDRLQLALSRWREKKNLVLQGPPGTGKTWLARRLAYALIGEKREQNVRVVQFHPNYSYEEFVRGWRPSGDGRLSVVDGVFLELIQAARNDPASTFCLVIEELNRGNPAHVFGELLTLMEAGKRHPHEAMELCHPNANGERDKVHVPENLYVIGTMNLADRSLALVDAALRRRFAYIDLEPSLGERWRDWVVENRNLDPAMAERVKARVEKLNDQIARDKWLGKQFCLGHSFVTPTGTIASGDSERWFQDVVHTEIGPVLDEYWFDAPETAAKAREALLKGD